MPPHRRRTCSICRVLDDALPVDRYLALSAESFGCGCSAEDAPDEDECDAPPRGGGRVTGIGQGGLGHGRR
jgi:hypothetical protein